MLPEDIPLFRLEDTGMGQQMQEYAVSQVLHWFRRFDDYQASNSNPTGSRCRSITRRFYHRYSRRGRAWLKSGRSPCPWGSRCAAGAAAVRIIRCESFAGTDELPAFLKGTRVLINLLPNTAETVGIINSTS
jgi:glyoxylate/hydroxypyruvate reductase A